MEAGGEEEEEEEEPPLEAWSDAARSTAATQLSGVLLAWTFSCVAEKCRSVAFAFLLFYVSLTAAASRNRRSLAAPFQVLIAAVLASSSSSFTSTTSSYAAARWRVCAGVVYVAEAVAWKGPTTDLITLAFGKFQRQLFATMVVATSWGVPELYRAAERLEAEAAAHEALRKAPVDELQRQFAAVLLYGGTLMLVSFSVAAWARIYRVAPSLFRLLVVVASAGALVGGSLRLAGADDAPMLAAASTAAFVAMAYSVLRDRATAHALHALAVGLYVASRTLRRPTFAFLCFLVLVLLKLAFLLHLNTLGPRRPRYLPRFDAGGRRLISPPLATLLFPPAPVPP